MASQRRKWQETLKNDCEKEKPSKKPKINILEEKVYIQQNGKLVLQKKKIHSQDDKDDTAKENLSDTTSSIQDSNSTSPHRKPAEIENLTPTFRKPKNYLAATAACMEEISPKSEQINRKLDIDQTQNDFLNSSITLNTAENISDIESYNFTTSENENTCITDQKPKTDTTSQTVSSVQSISPEALDLLDKICEIECNSPNWATCETYEIEVSVERNSGDEVENTHKTKLDTDVDLSKIKTKQQSNAIIFADTSEGIRPSSDINLAKSKDEKQKIKNVRRSKRKLNFNKSYLDFVDDDSDNLLLNEAFPSEESSLDLDREETNTSSSDSEQKNSKDKKKKNKLKKKRCNDKKTEEKDHHLSLEKSKLKTEIKKENNERKKKGESYINTKGRTVEGKNIKPNPCAGVQCGNNCGNISEERRENIFKYFWGLCSYLRRKDWIAQCALRKSVKRPCKITASNRCQTYEYYINESEGRRKVCQKFLIATLDITQRFILYTLDRTVDGFAGQDGRGSAGGHNRTSEEVILDAKNFIEALPLLPSHYCRKDSTKLYLPEDFKNVSNLYRIYQDHFGGKKIMSFKVFSGWFKKTFNIGFHIPKKDKCALCVSSKCFDVKTEEEMEKLQKHKTEKEESYNRFIFHQKLNKIDQTTVCASFDLQKVLNTPYGQSMTLYYSRKIAVYNFTIYESNTQLGICNLWTEADAKRGANEIATCLFGYIKNVDKRGNVKQIILYCDSAFGQNKNKTILAMLRYGLSICDNVETIQINYLIPGHTYMPVDSMHATIENSVKNSIVWAPSQWPTIIQFSRKNPEPYTVNVLTGEEFLGFENIVEHTFKKKQNIQISKISIVTFRKKQPEKMYVKTSMLPDAEATVVQLNDLGDANPKNKIYPSKLPICQKKYADLKKIVEKLVIPKRFAKEYLDFKTNAKVKDCLPDTDDEDDC